MAGGSGDVKFTQAYRIWSMCIYRLKKLIDLVPQLPLKLFERLVRFCMNYRPTVTRTFDLSVQKDSMGYHRDNTVYAHGYLHGGGRRVSSMQRFGQAEQNGRSVGRRLAECRDRLGVRRLESGGCSISFVWVYHTIE